MASKGFVQTIKDSMFGGGDKSKTPKKNKKDVFSVQGAQNTIRDNKAKKKAIMDDLFK